MEEGGGLTPAIGDLLDVGVYLTGFEDLEEELGRY